MPPRIGLTELAQESWLKFLHPGSLAIDATAGNGHDTRFLASHVEEGGKVFAIDLQPEAIHNSHELMRAAGLLDRVHLVEGNHADLESLLPDEFKGGIDLICFNLGYLPTGDHNFITTPKTTIAAMRQGIALLSERGALSVVAYRGHEGGMTEADAVAEFIHSLPPPWQCLQHQETGSAKNPGPVWWLVGR